MNDAQKVLEKYANEFHGELAIDNDKVIELLSNDCTRTITHGKGIQHWTQSDGSYISRLQDVYTFSDSIDVNAYNKGLEGKVFDHSIRYPSTHSLYDVGEFIFDDDVLFEDLQGLCLGLATDLKKWKQVARAVAVAPSRASACETVGLADANKSYAKNFVTYKQTGTVNLRWLLAQISK